MLQLIEKHGQKLGGRAISQAAAGVRKAREDGAGSLEQSPPETMASSGPAFDGKNVSQPEQPVPDLHFAVSLPSSSPLPAQSSSVLGPVTPEKPNRASLAPSSEEAGEAALLLGGEQYEGGTDGIFCSKAARSLSADLQSSLKLPVEAQDCMQDSVSVMETAFQSDLPSGKGGQLDELEGD